MSAGSREPAAAHHQDQVSPADLREAVGDDERGASPGSSVNRLLDLVLGGRVDGAGRIIQHEDARIGEEGARQCQPLALPAGKRDPAFTDDGVVAVRKGQDELVRLGGFGSRLDLFLGGTGFTEGNIFGDAAREQENILLNDGNVAGAGFPGSNRARPRRPPAPCRR